jgi:DsbC/DsbD-like thiol-disulfide interchange protein
MKTCARVFALLATLAVVPAGSLAAAPLLPGDALVHARLILDRSAIARHGTFIATVELTPVAGWHLYGPERADAGVPPAITWTLPPGLRAGAVAFPPARRVTVHGITTFVYEGRIALRIPIVALRDAADRRDARIVAHITWVACSSVCAPGGTTLSGVAPQVRNEP